MIKIIGRYLLKHFVCFLIAASIISCNQKNNSEVVINNQRTIIKRIYNKVDNLAYIYFPDSVIKQVYKENSNGKIQGKVIYFSSNGNIERTIFINSEGKEVGDESIFEGGKISEHFFRLAPENLIFYVKFKDGAIYGVDGHPWYIHGSSEIMIRDTASFYIASPIIPGFTTNVSFGIMNDPSSWVKYKNDIRQFTYNRIMNESGNFEFKLIVKIKDESGNTAIDDSTNFSVSVSN